MKLLTEIMPHLLLYGLALLVGIFVLVLSLWALGLTFSPFIWLTTKLFQSRCPKCKGFFKKKLLNWEVADEREGLKTVHRVDQGIVYSNRFLEPNHAIEINREEQVKFFRKTILNHWSCRNNECGHQWDTEEFLDSEGSID